MSCACTWAYPERGSLNGCDFSTRGESLARILDLKELGNVVQLRFNNCQFHGECSLTGELPFGATVDFRHCIFHKGITVDDLEWKPRPDEEGPGRLTGQLGDATAPDVVLYNCRIKGSFFVNRCTFRDLKLVDGTVDGEAEVRGSNFLRTVGIHGTLFGGEFVEIADNVAFSESFVRGCTFQGPLTIQRCRFGKKLDLSGSRFSGVMVRLDELTLDGGVSFRSCRSTCGSFSLNCSLERAYFAHAQFDNLQFDTRCTWPTVRDWSTLGLERTCLGDEADQAAARSLEPEDLRKAYRMVLTAGAGQLSAGVASDFRFAEFEYERKHLQQDVKRSQARWAMVFGVLAVLLWILVHYGWIGYSLAFLAVLTLCACAKTGRRASSDRDHRVLPRNRPHAISGKDRPGHRRGRSLGGLVGRGPGFETGRCRQPAVAGPARLLRVPPPGVRLPRAPVLRLPEFLGVARRQRAEGGPGRPGQPEASSAVSPGEPGSGGPGGVACLLRCRGMAMGGRPVDRSELESLVTSLRGGTPCTQLSSPCLGQTAPARSAQSVNMLPGAVKVATPLHGGLGFLGAAMGAVTVAPWIGLSARGLVPPWAVVLGFSVQLPLLVYLSWDWIGPVGESCRKVWRRLRSVWTLQSLWPLGLIALLGAPWAVLWVRGDIPALVSAFGQFASGAARDLSCWQPIPADRELAAGSLEGSLDARICPVGGFALVHLVHRDHLDKRGHVWHGAVGSARDQPGVEEWTIPHDPAVQVLVLAPHRLWRRPVRVVASSFVTVMLFAVLFFHSGIVADVPDARSLAPRYTVDKSDKLRIRRPFLEFWLGPGSEKNQQERIGDNRKDAKAFLICLYSSCVTFTTLGYGDTHPANETSRLLASLEAYSGAILLGLFVVTVFRRVLRS